jgi:hypothetical protein
MSMLVSQILSCQGTEDMELYIVFKLRSLEKLLKIYF